jgi:hypothetical protein
VSLAVVFSALADPPTGHKVLMLVPYVNAMKRREVHDYRVNGVCVMSTQLDPATVEILWAVQAAAMQDLLNAEVAEPSSAKEALARAKVARALFDAAVCGERDPERLKMAAIKGAGRGLTGLEASALVHNLDEPPACRHRWVAPGATDPPHRPRVVRY